METMNVREIVEVTGGQVVSASAKLENLWIQGISIDSRSIFPGEAFFALRGDRFDGHEFVGQALAKGAAAAVVSREWADDQAHRKAFAVPIVGVTDPLIALQELAGYYRRKFDVVVIAITGTNGKTTTKDMVAGVLSSRFCTMKTEGNFNNHIGVPLTLFRLSSADQMAVIEMGMSGLGEIHRSAEIGLPRHGVITNIGPAHLQQLKSLETITRAKFELLEMLPPEGCAFLNADDERLMAQRVIPPTRVVTFGMSEGADYRATKIESLHETGSSFEVQGQGQFQITTLGRHNVYNALAAIALGRELGLSAPLIRRALEGFAPSAMRMNRIVKGDVVILNDAYNANPTSMEAALGVLRELQTDGRKIAVLGEMLELGPQGPELHRQVGRLAAGVGIQLLLTVGQLAGEIAHGALQGGFREDKIVRCSDASQAAQKLKGHLRPGDVVLLKGSRKVQLESILSTLSSWPQKD